MYCNNFKYGNKPSVLYMMRCRMKPFFLINLRIYYLIRNLNVFSLGAVFLNNVFSFQDTIHIKTLVYLCKKNKLYKNISTLMCFFVLYFWNVWVTFPQDTTNTTEEKSSLRYYYYHHYYY